MKSIPMRTRAGMTLIEVLIAVLILGLALVVMLTAISRCLVVLRVSEDYHKAMWALSAAEADAPLVQKPDEEPEDMAYGPEEYDGIIYERTVEDPDVDDPSASLRLVRLSATLRWASRGKGQVMEVPTYILYEEGK
jgi:prepilin-type N-terminal cleavage/methylation domain-containing protein